MHWLLSSFLVTLQPVTFQRYLIAYFTFGHQKDWYASRSTRPEKCCSLFCPVLFSLAPGMSSFDQDSKLSDGFTSLHFRRHETFGAQTKNLSQFKLHIKHITKQPPSYDTNHGVNGAMTSRPVLLMVLPVTVDRNKNPTIVYQAVVRWGFNKFCIVFF